MADQKRIAIIGGGTFSHVRSHLAMAAPAFGTTACYLEELCLDIIPEMEADLYLTRMAGGDPALVTNEDVQELTDRLIADTSVKIIFFNAAMVDWDLKILDGKKVATNGVELNAVWGENGKYEPRPDSKTTRISNGKPPKYQSVLTPSKCLKHHVEH